MLGALGRSTTWENPGLAAAPAWPARHLRGRLAGSVLCLRRRAGLRLITPQAVRWNVHIALASPLPGFTALPVATAAVAAAERIAHSTSQPASAGQVAGGVTGEVAAQVAQPALSVPVEGRGGCVRGGMAAMRLSAQGGAALEQLQPAPQPVAADRPPPQLGTAGAAGVHTVGAGKALVGRQEPLVPANGEQGQPAQRLQPAAAARACWMKVALAWV